MGTQSAHLEIPDDVLNSARMTIDEMQVELAIHLYEQKRLSIGKAHELAGLSLWQFRQILGSRQIEPHFDVEDFEEDLETLSGLDAK